MRNKSVFSLALLLSFCICVYSQTFTTNVSPVGLEHNKLFNATTRYTVTQSGAAQINLANIFDGRLSPAYSNVSLDPNDPTIIEISGIPAAHTQRGAWIGWTTRWWMPTRFLVEGYDVYYGNGWVTVADYTNTNYSGDYNFVAKMPAGAYSKLRITIYQSNGEGGKFGISELFYIHPEVTKPYEGLYENINVLEELYLDGTNVGIGTENTNGYKLAVEGKIRAREIKVDQETWSDFVFHPNYQLRTLQETETFIKENGHLPDIPSAEQVEEEGISLGEMNAKLLQKIEELTLYNIEMGKILDPNKKKSRS